MKKRNEQERFGTMERENSFVKFVSIDVNDA